MLIELREEQKTAVWGMKNGCILCGGVGSGKSRTALAYYYIRNGGVLNSDGYVKMTEPKDLYIITTAKKRDSLEWEKEMVPFLLSTHDDTEPYTNKVVVDSWNNIKKYENVRNAFFIFDEQRLVGSGAWVQAFYKIAKKDKYGNSPNEWILLSATPGDTWQDYIPVFVANGFYRNKTHFCNEHVVWKRVTTFYKVDRYLNTRKLERLRNSILVDIEIDRHTVPHNEDVFVQYSVEKYRDIQRNRWNIWENKPIENATEYCYSLRKVVNTDESRQKAVLEIFEKHPKVIIFYNFDYELELLKSLYYGENVEIAEWNGHKHQEIPESESWVYLVQYNAGAEGWNCIKTDTIIFYSQNYSYKMLEQASGRIDRLNTPYTDLYYYHLKSRSGIDLAISRALKNKKNFNKSRFSGDLFKLKVHTNDKPLKVAA